MCSCDAAALGFLEARKYAHIFLMLVEIMMKDGRMPCFLAGPATLDNFRARFCLDLTEVWCVLRAAPAACTDIIPFRSRINA